MLCEGTFSKRKNHIARTLLVLYTVNLIPSFRPPRISGENEKRQATV